VVHRNLGLLAASVVVTWTLVGCGSGGSGTVAQSAQQAVSTAASKAQTTLSSVSANTTKTRSTDQPTSTTNAARTTSADQPATTTTATQTTTVTKPAESRTVTVTQSPESRTVTETSTASAPAPTTINNSTTAIAVGSTPATQEGSGAGIPWWGWLLIALGAIAAALAIFLLGRRSGGKHADGGSAGSLPSVPTGGSDDPGSGTSRSAG
jgi:hypothetical protein